MKLLSNKTRLYVGIFLISLAALAYEISLIRLFSISQWYHFAFMIVSIALFGSAAAGTYLAVKKLKQPLFGSSIFFSISVVIGFLITNELIFDPFKAVLNPSHILILLVYYIALGLPFFFFGIIIAHSLSTYQKHSGTIYFANLLGSSLGALAALFLIPLFQAKAVLIIALLGLIAAWLLIIIEAKSIKISWKKITTSGLIIVNILLLLFIPLQQNVSTYKELEQALQVPGAKLLGTRFGSLGRVDVVKSSFARYAPGLSPTFTGSLPEQIGLTVDASGLNAITRFREYPKAQTVWVDESGNASAGAAKSSNTEFFNHLPSAIPYFLERNKPQKVLIINAGAGLDVLTALEHGAQVTAVESNPTVINLLQDDYADFSGNIYQRAQVVFDEGRSFLKKPASKEKFDIIIISLAGHVLGDAAGISGLSENYLLTREALADYYQALHNDGLLVITRWLSFPPRESLRLFSLALTIDPTAQHITMFRSWTTVTLLLSKTDFNENRLLNIKKFVADNKFDFIYLPTSFTPNQNLRFEEPYYANAIQNVLTNQDDFYQDYVFAVSPVTDDQPFYFNFFKLSKIKEFFELTHQNWNPFLDSGFLLVLMLVQALLLALIFVILPLQWWHRKRAIMKTKTRPLLYFFTIGLSFLFIEIVLLQKYILFLGHATHASAVVIFAVLLFSALGALYSQRLNIGNIRKVILVLFVTIIIYLLVINQFINVFLSSSLIAKTIIGILLLAPLGFIMGLPFPLGIRVIKKQIVPWAWAINGSASILSPILAILIALYIGYNLVFLLAAVLYLVGSVFIIAEPHELKVQTSPQ